MTTRPWRQEIELLQNYSKHKTFTLTTSGASAETVVDISSLMEECNKISFVVELADAYVEFDGTATTSSMLIPQDEGYFDDNVYIGSSITIIRAGGTNARIRGIAWGR
tara:strand:- start:1172 stop:1495 length:324 start_codon:yes stop_codon:yes gene_type:complete